MKIVIDIPEEDYIRVCDMVKRDKRYSENTTIGTVYSSILHGTVLPKGHGELIERKELKEHKFLSPQVKVIGGRHSGKLKEQITQAYQKGWNDCIDAIIDNAPTIETDIEVVAKDAYEHGYTDGWKERFGEPDERPQGEWIKNIDKLGLSYICPFCGHEITGIPQDLNYCCKCGAKMTIG
jgi:hypothetical protein